MRHATVKTEKQAIKLVDDYLFNHMPEPIKDGMHLDSVIRPTSGHCACGETQGYEGWWEGGTYIVYVLYCDACGDDDAFEDEVIHLKI